MKKAEEWFVIRKKFVHLHSIIEIGPRSEENLFCRGKATAFG